MRRTKYLLEILLGPTLGAYFVTLTIILGWSAHRAYLRYFGIDPAGVDGASAETTVNYLGFGLTVIYEYIIFVIITGTIILSWFILYDFLINYLKNKKLLFYVYLFWPIITPILLATLGLFTFITGPDRAEKIGKEEAKIDLSNPRRFGQILKDAGGVLPTILDTGCWRKILQDKKNLYAYWDYEDGNLKPKIYIVPIENIKKAIEISSDEICKKRTKQDIEELRSRSIDTNEGKEKRSIN